MHKQFNIFSRTCSCRESRGLSYLMRKLIATTICRICSLVLRLHANNNFELERPSKYSSVKNLTRISSGPKPGYGQSSPIGDGRGVKILPSKVFQPVGGERGSFASCSRNFEKTESGFSFCSLPLSFLLPPFARNLSHARNNFQ